MALFNSCKYQGYTCHAVQYRRSEGIDPDFGFVEIARSDLKKIKMEAGVIPWTNLNSLGEVLAGTSIKQWRSKYEGKTTTAAPSTPGRKEGLNFQGDLELVTIAGGDTIFPPPITFKHIYVNSDGIEEVDQDDAFARTHKDGLIRVPITDIRKFWRDHGVITQAFNVKRENGEWDLETVVVDEDTGCFQELHPGTACLGYLFGQLPGSPVLIIRDPDAIESFSIEAIGENPLDVIRKVLVDQGLTARLLPDNRVLISKARVPAPVGKIAVRIGQYIDFGKLSGGIQSDEKESLTIHDRSPLVMVIGKRRTRRLTLACVPIFQDTDGRYYRLQDIASVYDGYTYDQVRKQVWLKQKSFQDVPPKFGSGAGQTHVDRRERLKTWAFKGYCPAIFFDLKLCQLEKTGEVTSVPFLVDRDFDVLPYLPMVEHGVYQRDFDKLDETPPEDAPDAEGDADTLFLLRPYVRAHRVTRGLYGEIDNIAKHYADLKVDMDFELKTIGFLQTAAADRSAKYVQGLTRVGLAVDSAKLQAQTLKSGEIVIDGDIQMIIAQGITAAQLDEADKMNLATRAFADNIRRQAVESAELTDQRNEIETAIDRHEKRVQDVINIFQNYGGVRGWFNMGQKIIDDGSAKLDPRTGIIMFTEPVGWMDEAFRQSMEGVEVITDGTVSVTFGYELKSNTITDFTSILVARTREDSLGPPAVVGVCRATPIKPRVIHVPDMRLYETDLGHPMNIHACMAQGLQAAGGHLRQATREAGRSYTFNGFVSAVLEEGVSTVQYVWNGDLAETFVAVNAPGVAGPLGTAKLGQVRSTVATRVTDLARAQRVNPTGRL